MAKEKIRSLNDSGSYIRKLRLEKGMTQAALAARLNITDKAVSKWERGLSFPDIMLLPRLSEVLGVGIADLIREYDETHDHEYDRSDAASRLMQRYEMSSDLRAPLHIMLGCAELIGDCRDDSERLERYLDAIQVSGRYLLSVLDDAAYRNRFEDYLRSTETKREPAAHDFSGSRVLIVDDMAVNREILAEILKKTGAETESADNGRVCVDMVASRPAGHYDLILMDILMPEMDGIEAARRIRCLADSAKASVPIVAVTSKVTDSEMKAAEKAGMDAFTEKPIRIDRLLETIRAFL